MLAPAWLDAHLRGHDGGCGGGLARRTGEADWRGGLARRTGEADWRGGLARRLLTERLRSSPRNATGRSDSSCASRSVIAAQAAIQSGLSGRYISAICGQGLEDRRHTCWRRLGWMPTCVGMTAVEVVDWRGGLARRTGEAAWRGGLARRPGEADWRGGLARRTGEAIVD